MLFLMSEVHLYEGEWVGCVGCVGVECEDRVLDWPASGGKGSKGRN